MPLYALGLMGATRRMQHYADPEWQPFMVVALVGAFAVTAIAGVIQAEVEYVPTVAESKPRAIPPVAWSAAPLVSPAMVGRGAILGLVGRF